jgi:hypothetical protein
VPRDWEGLAKRLWWNYGVKAKEGGIFVSEGRVRRYDEIISERTGFENNPRDKIDILGI